MAEVDLVILFVFIIPIVGVFLAYLPELIVERYWESISNFIERWKGIGRH